jgi:hypothetical protein
MPTTGGEKVVVEHPGEGAPRKRKVSRVDKRLCLWTCRVCDFPKNKDQATRCQLCGSPAPRTRFGIKVEGKHFLCCIKRGNALTSDSLVLIDVAPARGAPIKVSHRSQSQLGIGTTA